MTAPRVFPSYLKCIFGLSVLQNSIRNSLATQNSEEITGLYFKCVRIYKQFSEIVVVYLIYHYYEIATAYIIQPRQRLHFTVARLRQCVDAERYS